MVNVPLGHRQPQELCAQSRSSPAASGCRRCAGYDLIAQIQPASTVLSLTTSPVFMVLFGSMSKTFTASLHPKAKLAEFLGKWRGRPVVPGESIDLAKLIGACCTLVISHQQNMVGRTYASIDAVSKPTRKVVPSGHYDPALARQRIAEWKAKEAAGQRSEIGGQK